MIFKLPEDTVVVHIKNITLKFPQQRIQGIKLQVCRSRNIRFVLSTRVPNVRTYHTYTYKPKKTSDNKIKKEQLSSNFQTYKFKTIPCIFKKYSEIITRLDNCSEIIRIKKFTKTAKAGNVTQAQWIHVNFKRHHQ